MDNINGLEKKMTCPINFRNKKNFFQKEKTQLMLEKI